MKDSEGGQTVLAV